MSKQDLICILSDMLSNRCTPEKILSLSSNEVFVFGSNPDGEHKSNAAKLAMKEFGAKKGEGEGYYGQSYAIPVHRHRTWKMAQAVSRFLEFAHLHADKKFLVLPIGCGKAGMDVAEVAIMFAKAIEIDNIFLPSVFIKALKNYYISGCTRIANNLNVTVNECISSIRRNGFSPKGKIAMTRNYGYVLDDYGKQIFIGDEASDHLKKLKSESRIISIAGTFSDEVGLTVNGNIVTSIKNNSSSSNSSESSFVKVLAILEKHQFDDFKNVKSISAGEGHIVGVKYDGTVICWDGQGGWEGVPNFRNKVKEWQKVKQVAVGYENIIALTNDGKIFGFGHMIDYSDYYNDYQDYIQVDAYGHYYGGCYSMALRSNGTVISPDFDEVSKWKNVVQIAVGWDVALGLRRDGKVEIASPYDTEIVEMVSCWSHIFNIECKFSQIIAISEDGKIYSVKIH